MIGLRSDQRGLFEADHLYLEYVGPDSFYGFLASQRGRLFHDKDFSEFYCPDNGRDSVPPSLLATVLLLQTHDRVSDEEAKARADYDIRWKVALGVAIEERPFAKSSLQLFRAHLILHDKIRAVFQRSLQFARETGYMKSHHHMKIALDTTYILGRGAVKDTYNLLADGIVQVVRALAALEDKKADVWAKERGYERYFGSSIKGEASIDWDDKKARRAFLQSIVGDADRLLELARQAQGQISDDDCQRQSIIEASKVLGQLLLQDVERKRDGAAIKDGVSPDRIISVHDPVIRHGHKSSSVLFDGDKAAIAVDTDNQLFTAADVIAGNAPDKTGALNMVEQSEENTDCPVDESMGDCAYGDGATRQTFVDAGRTLIAKVPGRPDKAHFPKEDFKIDLEAGTCTCPAGFVTASLRSMGYLPAGNGERQKVRGFVFDVRACRVCSLKSNCISGKSRRGRTVRLHPQEALLQQARAFQHSEAFGEYRIRRQVAEHRLARLVQLGIRKARYFGRIKTRFQLLIAATVANLTLVAVKMGMMKIAGCRAFPLFFSWLNASITFLKDLLLFWDTFIALNVQYKSIQEEHCQKWAFRLDF
jgi:transposase